MTHGQVLASLQIDISEIDPEAFVQVDALFCHYRLTKFEMPLADILIHAKMGRSPMVIKTGGHCLNVRTNRHLDCDG